jgi:hypothetical protein
MAITDRRLRWLNLPEENVSICVLLVFFGTRATVKINNSTINFQFLNDSAAMMERRTKQIGGFVVCCRGVRRGERLIK